MSVRVLAAVAVLLIGLSLALPALDQFLLTPAPGSRDALSQLRHELAGIGTPHQATQVRDRAGVHGFRLHACAQFVEQCLRLFRAAPDQDQRRIPLIGKQGFRKNQFTTTGRAAFLATLFAHRWLLY